MPAGFKLPPELPEGVSDLLALTKYRVDYAPPMYKNAARVRNTGGYTVVSSDGAAHCVVKVNATLEDWRRAIGNLLDADLRWKEGRLATLFRDPLDTSRKI